MRGQSCIHTPCTVSYTHLDVYKRQAEIRFAIYEAATGNMIGIVACVAVVALGILYFLKLAPAREKAAKERLESGQ